MTSEGAAASSSIQHAGAPAAGGSTGRRPATSIQQAPAVCQAGSQLISTSIDNIPVRGRFPPLRLREVTRPRSPLSRPGTHICLSGQDTCVWLRSCAVSRPSEGFCPPAPGTHHRLGPFLSPHLPGLCCQLLRRVFALKAEGRGFAERCVMDKITHEDSAQTR